MTAARAPGGFQGRLMRNQAGCKPGWPYLGVGTYADGPSAATSAQLALLRQFTAFLLTQA